LLAHKCTYFEEEGSSLQYPRNIFTADPAMLENYNK